MHNACTNNTYLDSHYPIFNNNLDPVVVYENLDVRFTIHVIFYLR